MSDITVEQVNDFLSAATASTDLTVARLEPLSTLPHSYVAKLVMSDGSTSVFKRAGMIEFAERVRHEIAVNRDILSQLEKKPGPELLLWDGSAQLPWLVCEDVSETHKPIVMSRPANFSLVEQFTRALADLHAQTSQLDLPELFKNCPGEISATDGADQVGFVLDEFLRSCDDDQLPKRVTRLIETIRDNLPQLTELLKQHKTVLVHSDAHMGNGLFAEEAVLIDWAVSVMGPGEIDLCHALALNQPRLFAAEYEPSLIQTYVKTYNQHGFDLNVESVTERYRMCLLLTVVVSIGMHSVPGIPDAVRWYMFNNAVHSALDHHSAIFLSP